jgi:SAM-dependent methyltransferase
MTYKGIQKLHTKFGTGLTSFLDVGSGNGHLCLYMIDRPNIKKSIGIELVRERFEFAESLKSKLRKKNVSFINGSVLDVDLRTMFNEPVFVWWSNLCFDTVSVEKISEKLFTELPPGSVMCCSQQVGSREFETTMKVEMTWDKKSNVYIYKL